MAKNTANLSGEASSPLLFRHVSPGPGDSTLQFRLLHFWEARKNVKGGSGILLGIEMLMIDSEGTVARRFIGLNRRNQYEKELKRGMIYTLTNYYASNTKVMYHVADQRLVICISHASELRKVEEDIEAILTERFRIHSFTDFEANCDLRGDLHGKLCISSMSSSRVFLDEEVDPTKEYLTWLTTNPGATSSVNPVEVVKAETLTISEIAAFIKREPAKVIPIWKMGGDGAELEVPLPQCFIDAIGQTKKFRIKFCPQRTPPPPPLNTPAGTEVEISDVATSSGGGTSASDDEKNAKRTKRSG
ncbi:hypothetical protein YC2023_115385 [Brassica napus]